jgi:hypothetical protein
MATSKIVMLSKYLESSLFLSMREWPWGLGKNFKCSLDASRKMENVLHMPPPMRGICNLSVWTAESHNSVNKK